ncbi:YdcF family protein [bacterium]|nr:YdcF family protein [bacterium]
MKIAIILLYGLYDPKNTNYQAYFDFLITEIKKQKFDKVILCGGYTFPHIENISEAESAKKYLQSKSKYDDYILEDKSINTNQNLESASEHISSEDDLFVYGDWIRIAKISWMSAHFLIKEDLKNIFTAMMRFRDKKDIYAPFKIKNLTVIGYNFKGKSKEEMVEQTFDTLFDIMSLYNKDFEKSNLDKRKKDFGLKN